MIKLIISDFDGTLVNTFEANYLAYAKALSEEDIPFSREDYKLCYGLRFDNFMAQIGVDDNATRGRIKELKKQYYPLFFDHIQVNAALVELFSTFRSNGGLVAIASTAQRTNLFNVLNHIGLTDGFDLIKSGEDVMAGKPNPEIYHKVMQEMHVTPNETLIFEDSEVGVEAAKRSGAHWIRVTM